MALVFISWKAYSRLHVREETRNDGGSFIHVAVCSDLQEHALVGLQGFENKLQAAVLGCTIYRGLGDDGKLFIQVCKSVVVKRT